MSPLVISLVVTTVAFLLSAWWFGVNRRRKAETQLGVQALAGMKWRECVGLVLQALAEKGYREAPSSRQPGDGGTEFVLQKGDERWLLGYKHGTAYRLGEANVRDFANGVQLQGASNGILVTLGSAEGFARDLARRYGVELIDGASLWPQVEPFAPAGLIEGIRTQAAAATRRGQHMGIVASIVLGVLSFGVLTLAQPGDPAPAAPGPAAAVENAAGDAPAAAAEPAEPAYVDPASRQASEALEQLQAVAKLTDEERVQRRLMAARRVAELEAVVTATWSTQSTLVMSLADADGIDSGVVNEACSILVEYEEMRYSRLQLEPPADSKTPVRWRQCQ